MEKPQKRSFRQALCKKVLQILRNWSIISTNMELPAIKGKSIMAALHKTVPGFLWNVPANLSDLAVQERLSPSAIKAFFRIVSRWKVRDEDARQLLGGVSNGTFYHLKGGTTKRLDQDRLTRISLLLGIFKALHVLYGDKLADAWVSLPNTNPIFAGEAPLSFMTKGGVPSMIRVRQLLDARRGGR